MSTSATHRFYLLAAGFNSIIPHPTTLFIPCLLQNISGANGSQALHTTISLVCGIFPAVGRIGDPPALPYYNTKDHPRVNPFNPSGVLYRLAVFFTAICWQHTP
jgi:hypothetical protein